MIEVIACPICGKEATKSCYHNGNSLSTVSMTVDVAIERAEDYLERLGPLGKRIQFKIENHEHLICDLKKVRSCEEPPNHKIGAV